MERLERLGGKSGEFKLTSCRGVSVSVGVGYPDEKHTALLLLPYNLIEDGRQRSILFIQLAGYLQWRIHMLSSVDPEDRRKLVYGDFKGVWGFQKVHERTNSDYRSSRMSLTAQEANM